MRGVVVKRGPSTPGGRPRKRPWGFVIDLDPLGDNRRQQITKSGFATKREANEALQQELRSLSDGYDSRKGKVTVKEFLEEQWLPGLSRVRATTYRSYESLLKLHVIPTLGAVALRDLTTPHLNALYARLGRSRDDGGAGLKPSSVRRVHAAIRAALADAVKWRLVPHNVAVGAELPPDQRQEPASWTAKEARTFLSGAEGDGLAAMYALLLATGLRRGEACGLQWGDVDLVRASLVVRRQLTDNGYKVAVGAPKSKKGLRVVGLDARTVAVLKAYRQEVLKRPDGHRHVGPDRYLFTRPDGEPYHPDFVSKHFNMLVRHLGMRRIRLHDLRHTHATLGLAAGIPAKVMADRLGHSTVLLTLDTYSHVTPAMDHEAAETIASLMAEAQEDIEDEAAPDGAGPDSEGRVDAGSAATSAAAPDESC